MQTSRGARSIRNDTHAGSQMVGFLVASMVSLGVVGSVVYSHQDDVAASRSTMDRDTRDLHAERFLAELLSRPGTEDAPGLKNPDGRGIDPEPFLWRNETLWTKAWAEDEEYTDDPLVFLHLKDEPSDLGASLRRVAETQEFGYRLEINVKHGSAPRPDYSNVRAAYFGEPVPATGTDADNTTADAVDTATNESDAAQQSTSTDLNPNPGIAQVLGYADIITAEYVGEKPVGSASEAAGDAEPPKTQPRGNNSREISTLSRIGLDFDPNVRDYSSSMADPASDGQEAADAGKNEAEGVTGEQISTETRVSPDYICDCEVTASGGPPDTNSGSREHGDVYLESQASTSLPALMGDLTRYDLLVIGSDVDHRLLDNEDIKNALHEWVVFGGGYLLVLGSKNADPAFLEYMIPRLEFTQDELPMHAYWTRAHWDGCSDDDTYYGDDDCRGVPDWVHDKFRRNDGGKSITHSEEESGCTSEGGDGWTQTYCWFYQISWGGDSSTIAVSKGGEYGTTGRIAILGEANPETELWQTLFADRSKGLYQSIHHGYEIPSGADVSTAVRLSSINDRWVHLPVEVRLHMWDLATGDAYQDRGDDLAVDRDTTIEKEWDDCMDSSLESDEYVREQSISRRDDITDKASLYDPGLAGMIGTEVECGSSEQYEETRCMAVGNTGSEDHLCAEQLSYASKEIQEYNSQQASNWISSTDAVALIWAKFAGAGVDNLAELAEEKDPSQFKSAMQEQTAEALWKSHGHASNQVEDSSGTNPGTIHPVLGGGSIVDGP